MFRSILVPLDGSEFAEVAIPPALSIASRAGASLELLRVHELYTLHDPHACWIPYEPDEDARFRANEQAYLDVTAKRLQTGASIHVTSTLVDGLIEDAILESARTRLPDLVVMAIHGRGPLGRLCFGSVAEKFLLQRSAPLLLVRRGKPPVGQRPEPAFKRILIPLDGSQVAETVLEPAVALGTLSNSEYTLVRVVPASRFLDGFAVMADPNAIDEGCEQRKAEARGYLDGVAARLLDKGLRVQTRVVVGRSPCAAILDDVRAGHVDLIAIATHRRSVLQRLFVGCVADGVTTHSTVPVLVFCPA
jgi:nucleotide-binding universal stress UspA family protein